MLEETSGARAEDERESFQRNCQSDIEQSAKVLMKDPRRSTETPSERPASDGAGASDAAAMRSARPLQRLLTATDLSARSDRALERALELAQRHRARLTVVHVVDEDLPTAAQKRLEEVATSEIEARITKMGRPDGADIVTTIHPGKDYRDILRAADAGDADLIVLGIHRNESGRNPIVGTTMERVIRLGSRPILVVSSRVAGPYKKVLVGVDFSAYSRIAIRAALALVPEAEFFFIHAFHVPFEGFLTDRGTHRTVRGEHERKLAQMVEEEMEALIASASKAESAGQRFHKVVLNGDVQPCLRAEVERLEPDLLVLGTHGRVGIAHMVLGSTAEDFLNRPPCDVLAVKAW